MMVIGLLVSGCGGQLRSNWVRPDGPTDYAQLRIDWGYCNQESSKEMPNQGLIFIPYYGMYHAIKYSYAMDAKLHECMKERGYVLKGDLKTTKGYVKEEYKEDSVDKKERDEIWVMVFPEGRFYHIRSCPVLKSSIGQNMKLKDAEKRGYLPCPHCIK